MPIKPMLFAKATAAAFGPVQASGSQAFAVQASTTYNNVMPAAVTVGNDLILVTSHYRGGAGQISAVTMGGAAAVRDQRYSLNGSLDLEIWRARATSTSRNVSITYSSGSTHDLTFGVLETTPLAATPIDRQANTGAVTGTTAVVATAPGANAQANELVIAGFAIIPVGTVGVASPAATGYTALAVEQNNTAFCTVQASYKKVTAIETSSATWTRTLSGNASGIITTYKY